MKRKDGRYLQLFPGVQGTQRVVTLPGGWLVDVTFTHVPQPHTVAVRGVTVPTLADGARWLTLVPTQGHGALLVILTGETPVFADADVCAATGRPALAGRPVPRRARHPERELDARRAGNHRRGRT
ncbi:hypothetical protein GCM10008956_10740 [Deinococcus arenae]|uniref:Uncharacterized protein n=1 Tax=Deinococcus arenae TaxID=1452751 RepID=A0A8H9GLR3_9DEIO|nr:hypothetical protein GCM10008956_10740 [Deinococcus arenae]